MDMMDERSFSDLGELTEQEWVLLRSLRILNIEVQWLSGLCPVQAQGLAQNLPFYFRARGHHWSFALAYNPSDDPVRIPYATVPGYYLRHDYGEIPDAGYMPVYDVLAFIGYAVAEWRSERNS